jgi:YD repeat-containing protein
VTTFTYAGGVTAVEDPLGRVTTAHRSEYGLPIAIEFADGTWQTATYLGNTSIEGAAERPTSITDELGRVRSFSYDEHGALVGATDLADAAYSYGRSNFGVTSILMPGGEQTTFAYDSIGRRTTRTEPNGGIRRWTYGANGLPATEVTPNGLHVAYAYDSARRPISRIAENADYAALSWNESGLLSSLEDESGTSTYGYDQFGGLSRINAPNGGGVTFHRDPLGRVTQIETRASASDLGRVTSYTYDAAGNLLSVIDPTGGVTTFVYDSANRLILRTLPNGVNTTYTYDRRDRPTAIIHRWGDGGLIASVASERDASGAPTRITREGGASTAVQYDGASRVISETFRLPNGEIEEASTYGYDQAGNRLAHSANSISASYTYLAGSILQSVSGQDAMAFSYDQDGRVTSIDRDGLVQQLA